MRDRLPALFCAALKLALVAAALLADGEGGGGVQVRAGEFAREERVHVLHDQLVPRL